MAMQEKLNRDAVRHLSTLGNTIKMLWTKACEHDSIPTGSKFVIFSDTNPYVKFHGIALRQYWADRQAFANGGYVGLQIKGGKARA